MLLLDPFLREPELFERVMMLTLKLALTIGLSRFPCLLLSIAGDYFIFTMPGGFQVPSPGGRMEGGSVFGQ